MPVFKESKLVKATQEEVMTLVLDVNSYRTFLPWCKHSRVISHDVAAKTMNANLSIGFGLLNYKYSSNISYDTNSLHAKSTDKLFSHMSSKWILEGVDGGCQVTFEIDFDIASRGLSKVLNKFFHLASQRIINAFEDEINRRNRRS